jgi:hypothetical protein
MISIFRVRALFILLLSFYKNEGFLAVIPYCTSFHLHKNMIDQHNNAQTKMAVYVNKQTLLVDKVV